MISRLHCNLQLIFLQQFFLLASPSINLSKINKKIIKLYFNYLLVTFFRGNLSVVNYKRVFFFFFLSRDRIYYKISYSVQNQTYKPRKKCSPCCSLTWPLVWSFIPSFSIFLLHLSIFSAPLKIHAFLFMSLTN